MTTNEPDNYDLLLEGNARQPRKRVSADVLLRDSQGRVLLVDPSYKSDWDLPGGMCEANEAPRATAARELKEELAINIDPGRLLVVEWVVPHGPWDDLLAMVFDGGELSSAEMNSLRPADGEILAFEFVDLSTARERLRPYVWNRLSLAHDALHNGSPLYQERRDLS